MPNDQAFLHPFIPQQESDAYTIIAALLSLASNHHATKNLTLAINELKTLGNIQTSPVIINPDKNATTASTLLYHNQMLLLTFHQPISYQAFFYNSKHLEQLAHRQKNQPQVTLDIDIIAILPSMNTSQKTPPLDENHQAMLPIYFNDNIPLFNQTWWAISRRMPLNDYEKQGLDAILHQKSNT